MKLQIAEEKHFQSILSIYNWAILNTTSTFDTDEKTLEDYSSFLCSFTDHPLIVCIIDGRTVGWGCLKRYSDRHAYRDTVELSVYVHPQHFHQGIGSKMMNELILLGKKCKFHTILSRISADSKESIALHKKFNFIEVGVMKEVGWKFNKRIDVIIMQKLL